MTSLLPTTLLTLLIASPLLIWAAVAWRQASARVDDAHRRAGHLLDDLGALRIPGSDDELCTQCTQKVATQPEDGGLCIECWILRPAIVAGGVEALCMSLRCHGFARHTHPDGGPGGLCDPCHTELDPDLGGH